MINLDMLKKLKKLRKQLNKINNLNFGGCAITSLAIYKWIEENYPNEIKNTHIVFLFDELLDEDLIQKDINNNLVLDYLPSCNHSMIKYHNLYLDSDNIITEKPKRLNNKEYTHELFFDKLSTIYSINSNYWNDAFDRESGIPKIEKILNVTLNEIDIEIYYGG